MKLEYYYCYLLHEKNLEVLQHIINFLVYISVKKRVAVQASIVLT